MSERQTPETKWYVTEYPDECSFAITDGNEILATIIGGNTIGDQCDLATRIAKLPDLERERDEAIDNYQSLQKTFEEWQLKFLREQAELLHNKDVQYDKLFDEAYQIRIERDEALSNLEFRRGLYKVLEEANNRLRTANEEAVELARTIKQERDEAREAAAKWESSFNAMERAGAEQASRADENREWALRAEREHDEAREALENHTASTTHTCHSECKRPMCVLRRELNKEQERAKELAELVDGAYIFVELHKPEGRYNKQWRVAWMEKAKRLIPGVDSIWY